METKRTYQLWTSCDGSFQAWIVLWVHELLGILANYIVLGIRKTGCCKEQLIFDTRKTLAAAQNIHRLTNPEYNSCEIDRCLMSSEPHMVWCGLENLTTKQRPTRYHDEGLDEMWRNLLGDSWNERPRAKVLRSSFRSKILVNFLSKKYPNGSKIEINWEQIARDTSQTMRQFAPTASHKRGPILDPSPTQDHWPLSQSWSGFERRVGDQEIWASLSEQQEKIQAAFDRHTDAQWVDNHHIFKHSLVMGHLFR